MWKSMKKNLNLSWSYESCWKFSKLELELEARMSHVSAQAKAAAAQGAGHWAGGSSRAGALGSRGVLRLGPTRAEP